MIVALVATACAAPAPVETSPATPATTAVAPTVPAGLAGLDIIDTRIGDEVFRLAVADTPATRVQGLRGITDLGPLDGMLFAATQPSTVRFTMADTLIALDIAFFRADGSLIDVLEMVPCDAEPCPTYGVDEPVQWAVEVPAGHFAGLEPTVRLRLP